MPSWAGSDVQLFTPLKSQAWLLPGVSDLVVGWEANQPGSMTFRVSQAAVQQVGPSSSGWTLDLDVLSMGGTSKASNPVPSDGGFLLGKWVEYTHPSAGLWGGRITSVSYEDGLVSVGAEGYLSLLKAQRPTYGDGEVALQQFLDSMLSRATLGRGMTYTLAGVPNVPVQAGSYDVLTDVVAQAIEEKVADGSPGYLSLNPATRALKIFDTNPQPGGQVTLAAGNNVIGWTVGQDLWAGANSLMVQQRYLEKSGKKTIKKTAKLWVSTAGLSGRIPYDIDRIDRVEVESVQLSGVRPSASAAQTVAQNLVRARSRDFLTFTLRLVDLNGTFAGLASANTYGYVPVTLDLGPITQGPTNTTRPVVNVVARSLDVQTGVMTATAVWE